MVELGKYVHTQGTVCTQLTAMLLVSFPAGKEEGSLKVTSSDIGEQVPALPLTGQAVLDGFPDFSVTQFPLKGEGLMRRSLCVAYVSITQ